MAGDRGANVSEGKYGLICLSLVLTTLQSAGRNICEAQFVVGAAGVVFGANATEIFTVRKRVHV